LDKQFTTSELIFKLHLN